MSSSSVRLDTDRGPEVQTKRDELKREQQSSNIIAIASHPEQVVQPDTAEASRGNEPRSSRTDVSYPFDTDLFYSPPTEAPAAVQALEDIEYDEPTQEDLIHPPDFKPFFTLIEDPQNGEHHHPTVHYVFSDDDPEILTAAVLDTLDQTIKDKVADDQKSDEIPERCVIVDMAAAGKTIVSASSLSPDWQVVTTNVTQAPSWGEQSNGDNRGLMLRICGQHSGKQSVVKQSREHQGQGGNIEDLVNAYHERLRQLDEVLGRTPVEQ